MIIHGNNIEKLKEYPDNYFDAVVTDPPYGLGKEPDAIELMKDWVEKGYHEITGGGFMGKEWDSFVPQPNFWKEVFRVLKHGGHVVSFFGTRTYDWGVMAMRFAGFEVRDCIQWIYGSGFPKSHNISKAIDKMEGAEREVIGQGKAGKGFNKVKGFGTNTTKSDKYTSEWDITNPATDQAKLWDGWGSALKPANEPIVLARKPLEKGLSIAENVLKWGTGGINIDGCRIGYSANNKPIPQLEQGKTKVNSTKSMYDGQSFNKSKTEATIGGSLDGRFPANLILTHHPECECIGLKKVGGGKDGGYNYEGNIYEVEGFVPNNSPNANSNYGKETVEDWQCVPDCPIKIMDEQSGISKTGDIYIQKNTESYTGFKGDTGGASRFFYVAKASKSERNRGLDGFEEKYYANANDGKNRDERNNYNQVSSNKNIHPTVKPVKLMQYLVRLVTPPNGIVLDPFCGSGTTGIACKLEGFDFVGIEQDEEYSKIAIARIDNYSEEPEDDLKILEQEQEENNKVKQLSIF